MEPKGRENELGSPSFRLPKHFANTDSIFLPFWGASGRLLASILNPFRHAGTRLVLPWASFRQPLKAFRPEIGKESLPTPQ